VTLKRSTLCAVVIVTCCLTLTQPRNFAQSSPILFSTGAVSVAVARSNILSVRLPIINTGTGTASKVQVTSIGLGTALRIAPTSFPIPLGDMPVGKVVTLGAMFDSSSLTPGNQYLLMAQGIYLAGGVSYGFAVNRYLQLPNNLNGSTDTFAISLAAHIVVATPLPPGGTIRTEIDSDIPSPPIPEGPFRPRQESAPTFVRTTTLTSPATVPSPTPNPTGSVTILKNTAASNIPAPVVSVRAPEPSLASSGTVVIVSGNRFGGISTDGGDSFRYIDPNTIFADTDGNGNLLDGGFCCDQVVQYIPSIDRFVWMALYLPSNCPPSGTCLFSGVNRLRIAVASPEDASRTGLSQNSGVWRIWDLTSAAAALGNNWMDYPDLAVGDNYLYVSTNVLDDDINLGTLVARIPLNELRDGNVINLRCYRNGVNHSVRVTQNTGDTAFWASHNNTSQTRVFSWAEADQMVYVRDINIAQWPNVAFSSFAPDGTDWLATLAGINPRSQIIGATRRLDELWLAWTTGRDVHTLPVPNSIPYPRIEFVRLDASTFKVIQQDRIWSPDYAYAYPALTTNSSGDVGISFSWGGNLTYPNHGVGILTGSKDLVSTTASDAAQDRWGDYVTVRQQYPDTNLFWAGGYSLLHNSSGTASGIRAIPNFTLFGRSSVPPK
jgi:hypothetical protein